MEKEKIIAELRSMYGKDEESEERCLKCIELGQCINCAFYEHCIINAASWLMDDDDEDSTM